jgi:hypothetical protein
MPEHLARRNRPSSVSSVVFPLALALLLLSVTACGGSGSTATDPGGPPTAAATDGGSTGEASPDSAAAGGDAKLAPMTGKVTIGDEVIDIALFGCLLDLGAFRAEGTYGDGGSIKLGLVESVGDSKAPYIRMILAPGEWVSGTIAAERGAVGADMTDIVIDGTVGRGKAVFADGASLEPTPGSFEFACQ